MILASNSFIRVDFAGFSSLSYPVRTRPASIRRDLQQVIRNKRSLTCSLYGDGSASPFCTPTYLILSCPERG